MNADIRGLSPEHTDGYASIFGVPNADRKEAHKSYCVWDCDGDCAGEAYASTAEARRNCADRYVLGRKTN